MKTLKSILLILVLIFAVMFAINALIMRAFFGVDITGSLVGLGVPIEMHGQAVNSFGGEKGAERHVEWEKAEDMGGKEDKGEKGTMGDTVAADDAGGTATSNGESAGAGFYISPEEIRLLNRLSLADKLKVMSMASKINRKELSRIINLSKDGITYDEAYDLAEFAKKNLEPSEIETLVSMLDKNRLASLSDQAENMLRLVGEVN